MFAGLGFGDGERGCHCECGGKFSSAVQRLG